ncbi:Fis family transcriptional regulator [Pseudomonas syringae pv. berberidis]|nr:Fis family transcriptional regulator [Pseudomonas syringae pv. berberidis]
MGRRRSGTWRRGHCAGWQPAGSGRAHQGIRRPGHRELHFLGLPAPGRSLPFCRTGLPATARALCQPRRAWYHQPDGPVRRNDRQRSAPAGQVMSGQLLTLPHSPALATSIRATAQVFEDPKSRALLAHVRQVAPSDASVLIIGETGTGKELVARHVHELSARRDKPFVAVNCGAFSENLIEAELFGHDKGAFTGAISAKAGWFEEANGGTLFLDEIGDLPMTLQVKLLRVLQEREVVRLGSRKSIPIDVRVLAATNVQLEKAINAGHFREDLYYRLDVVNLELSPLRDRPGDILPLARHFIEVYSQRLRHGPVRISAEAEHKLRTYSWPGNIRELENVIHHTLLVCRDGIIQRDDLRMSNLRIERQDEQNQADESAEQLLNRAFQKLFEEQAGALHEKVEDTLLRTAYRFCHHNQVHTASLLGLTRNVTRTRLIKIGELAVNKRRPGENVQGDRMLHLSV